MPTIEVKNTTIWSYMPPIPLLRVARTTLSESLHHHVLRSPCQLIVLDCHESNYLPSQLRQNSTASSTRWKSRQGRDSFAREAKVQGLKSRAAFKLLEIDAKYKLFKRGQTVVDLGYAPGSWSQVAVERTKPNGRIVGIDIIPAQPPKGVSTIQGNFLSKEVQGEIKQFLKDPNRGRRRQQLHIAAAHGLCLQPSEDLATHECHIEQHPSLTDLEDGTAGGAGRRVENEPGKTIDIVLSDMSAPWEQTSGFWKRSLSNPYIRMMNTSGIPFRDHTGSMDLCDAALKFSYDTLKTGGHFVCKFYQGAEDKLLEVRLKKLFAAVYREKPESSRSESKEAYFVALRRRGGAKYQDIFDAGAM